MTNLIRYRIAWWYWIGIAGAIVMQGVFIAMVGVPAWYLFRISSSIHVQLILLASLFTITASWMVYTGLRLVLEVRRGGIYISEEGITIIDWRLREKEILWDDINQLRITTWGGLRKPPELSIVTRDNSIITFSQGLQQEDNTKLADMIIDRLSMEKISDTWFRCVFQRSIST